MIQKTYHDGNREDRAYVADLWSWLKDQPQDAWLLWARQANWDNADTIFAAMIEDPRCDLALVSWIFWHAEPAYWVRNPDRFRADDLVGRITSNVAQGFYGHRDLFSHRLDIISGAMAFVMALREGVPGTAPFRLPRVLLGPFEAGRPATLPARYDAQTEAELAEVFRCLDGGLPRAEAQYRAGPLGKDGLWLKPYLTLPRLPPDPEDAFRALDDAAYVEAIFGTVDAYARARGAAQSGQRPAGKVVWWPFGW